MKVIIDKKWKVDFSPDAQHWTQQNPPAQFCITQVGRYECFVKRQRSKFDGWGLLVKAISQRQIRCTPRIVSIARCDDYFYFFMEKVEGITLEEYLRNTGPLRNPKRLLNNIYLALYDINHLGFWYTDLCRKNILTTDSGDYYLIDIDSCRPHSEVYSYRKVAFEYPPLLITFARTIGQCPNFNIGNIPGECVNQAELVAFAMDVKQQFKIPIDKKASVIHSLLLRAYQTEYKDLFVGLMRGQSDWLKTKRLIDKLHV